MLFEAIFVNANDFEGALLSKSLYIFYYQTIEVVFGSFVIHPDNRRHLKHIILTNNLHFLIPTLLFFTLTFNFHPL